MAVTTASRQRRTQRLSRPVRYLLLVAAGGLLLNLLVGDSGLLAMLAANRQYTELEKRVEALRRENEVLREEARRLLDDPSRIEEVARGELGLMRPGEKLFIVRPGESDR